MQLENLSYHKPSLSLNFTLYYSLLVFMLLYLVRATEISSNAMRYDNETEVMLELVQNCFSSLEIIQ